MKTAKPRQKETKLEPKSSVFEKTSECSLVPPEGIQKPSYLLIIQDIGCI
jgi:hypothetical protein